MVVVPTDTEVRLVYGRSPVEWFSTAVTLAGLAAVAWLVLRPRRAARAETSGTEAPAGGLPTDGASGEAAGP